MPQYVSMLWHVCWVFQGTPTGGGEGRQALHTPQVQRVLLHEPWLLRRKRDCTPALFLTSSVCTSAMSLCTSEEEGVAPLPSSSQCQRVLRRRRGRAPPPRNVGKYMMPMTEGETPEHDGPNVSAQLCTSSLGARHTSMSTPPTECLQRVSHNRRREASVWFLFVAEARFYYVVFWGRTQITNDCCASDP